MTAPSRAEKPHLVSLVLQSKKALQHGELLCSKANTLTSTSAQCAVDVLALDAKVRWISDAVIKQLKLAASVAKSLEHKRVQLDSHIRQWDTIRSERTSALDTILESLGTQLVPPGFHETSSASSLFGSQHSLDKDKANGNTDPTQSPSATVRGNMLEKKFPSKPVDRSAWKTLRDFVDESAIEQMLDAVESDRTRFDDVKSATYDYPETLSTTVSSIRGSLPTSSTAPLPPIEALLASQEKTSAIMARHLESLASHYEQMADALHDNEAGIAYPEEEMQAMHRDTDELPVIMEELEQDVRSIEEAHEKLEIAKTVAQQQLDTGRSTLDDLDELGDIMSDMIQKQQEVEADCEDLLESLQQRLLLVEDLHHRFVQYQSSFHALLIEIDRRRQERDRTEKEIQDIMSKLDDIFSKELQEREKFHTNHGSHIPTDVCLCVENLPTRWEVVPLAGDMQEVLPEIDADLLMRARGKLMAGEVVMSSVGTDSVHINPLASSWLSKHVDLIPPNQGKKKYAASCERS